MHLDWGASQFLTKQWQVGVVGYWYNPQGLRGICLTEQAGRMERVAYVCGYASRAG